MAALVATFVKEVRLSGGAGPGALAGEIWNIPAGAIADTATITPKRLATVIAAIGGGHADHPSLAAGPSSVTLTLRVANTQTVDVMVVGALP